MPPRIDEDSSPVHSPNHQTSYGSNGPTTAASLAVETANNEDGNGSNSDVPDLLTFEDAMFFVSREIFHTRELRLLQKTALFACINPYYTDSKQILVLRTGYGKSHVMRTLGVMVGGIVIIFVPLLSLSADQMNKMKEASQKFGTVETHHLDEFPTNDGGTKLRTLVDRINGLKETTTSTIFLFTSPQFMCKSSNKSLLDALLSAHQRAGVLRVVGIDEAHLFVLHSLFRVEIHMLTELFFKKIFNEGNVEWQHPILLAMTATMPLSLVPKLEALTNVTFENHDLYRPGTEHFQRRYIKIEYGVRSDTFAQSLDRLVDVLTNSILNEEHPDDECVVVIVTTAADAIAFELKLSEKLNKAKCDVDIVLVHGQQDKRDKFYGMRLFCKRFNSDVYNPRALVTNGAGNTGIDNPNITEMLRGGFPIDVLSVCQEVGRCARGEEARGRVKIMGSVKSLEQNLHLLHQLKGSSKTKGVGGGSDNFSGAGSAIRNSAIFSENDTSTTEEEKNNVYKQLRKDCTKIMNDENKKSLKLKEEMQLDVLDLLCLDKGCVQARMEAFLSAGKLKAVDRYRNSCGGMCPICESSWQKLHLQVRKMKIISWFQSFAFVQPIKANELTNCLWKGEEKWIREIFGIEKKYVKKYHVESLMLSLIAAKIIVWRVKEGHIEWWLNRIDGPDGTTLYCYTIDEYWNGIPQRF